MKSLAIAFGLFTVNVIVLLTMGDRFLKEEPRAAQVTKVTAPARFNLPAMITAERPETPIASSDYAKICAAYDTISHPEQVADIELYASAVTGTPAGMLHGIWRNETGNVDGFGLLSGGCGVMSELSVRDGAAGTRHAEGMLKMADVFGWKGQYGDDLKGMTCSCPPRDQETGERKPHSYGGSCGPFQFSGAEVDDEYAIPLHLDPMTFCGGALIAGWELKKHHDSALARHLADDDAGAWLWAANRYLGNFDGHYSNAMLVGWRAFQTAYDADPNGLSALRQMIANDPHTRSNVRYLRTFASN